MNYYRKLYIQPAICAFVVFFFVRIILGEIWTIEPTIILSITNSVFCSLYFLACYRFVIEYRKDYQSINMKTLFMLVLGGFYNLFRFKFWMNRDLFDQIEREHGRGDK